MVHARSDAEAAIVTRATLGAASVAGARARESEVSTACSIAS